MNTDANELAKIERYRVRLWFGEYTIADYSGEPEMAARYADAMRRRFPGLRITMDPIPRTARGSAGLNT
jgi:hypothetical protein